MIRVNLNLVDYIFIDKLGKAEELFATKKIIIENSREDIQRPYWPLTNVESNSL